MFKKFLVMVAFVLFLCSSAYASIWGVRSTSDGNEILNIDPFSGSISSSFAAPTFTAGNTGIGLAGWSNELFYTNSNSENGKIYVINPSNGSVTNSFTVSGGWGINGIGYYSSEGNGYIYTSGCSVGDVHRYNAVNGSSPTYYWSDINGPLSVAGDNGGRIYTAGSVNGVFGLYQLDPLADTGAVWFAGAPSQNIVGMAYDGTYLYISDASNNLYTINNSGRLVNTLQLDYTLWGLGSTEGTGRVTPIPAAVWLLGSGLFGLVGIKKKLSV